jgi:protein-S-isoprenylcysteine O-methyltransferase Ste14/Fe2+ transport system protein FeoA
MRSLIEQDADLAPALVAVEGAPCSATALSTGFAGLLGALGSFVLVMHTALAPHLMALGIVAGAAVAMIAVEILDRRACGRTSFALGRALARPLDVARVGRKLIGLTVTLGAIAAAYWLLAEYRRDFFAPFFAAVSFCWPAFAISAPLYVAYVDRRQADPEDVYAEIGAFMLSGQAPRDLRGVGQHALGWAVKAFFLPLMFVFLCSLVGNVEKTLESGDLSGFMAWNSLAQDVLFGLDVLFACVGYILTLRLLDTHIRSVEPTVIGWVACLICYEPFNRVTNAYIVYDEAGNHWDAVLTPWPLARLLWGIAILSCLVVYAWSTVCFGLRFSNLTNRGVITVGPYRWVKHPAYLVKNLSWWLISMPFLSSAGFEQAMRDCAMLLLFNGVYLLRAITEERHLSRDPAYLAYKAYIARHGLWARLKQAVGGGRAWRRSTSRTSAGRGRSSERG